MIAIALGVIALSLFAYWAKLMWDKTKHWEKKGIKHLKPVFFFGNYLPLVFNKKGPQDIIDDLYKAYPKEQVLGLYEFTNPRLIIRDGDLVQKVLIKDFGHFTDHGFEINIEKNPTDEQLFVMSGTRWRAFRIKLSPIFTSGKLKEMFSTMQTCGDNLLGYFQQREKEEIDAREVMGLFSMDIIGSAVFGMDPATLKNPECEFRKIGRAISNPSIANILRMYMAFAFPKLMNYLGISFQDQSIAKYYRDLIQNTIDYRKEKGIYRNDFIQMMMQLKEKGQIEVQNWDANDDYLKTDESVPALEKFEITDTILMAQAQAFMMAGFEATALLMAYTLFELTQHQDIQDRLREEAMEQVKHHGQLTYDALKNMKYLEAIVKETQRYYPIVPYLFRKCTKTYELPNGYVINKEDSVSIPVAAIHMDPNNYPEPKEFRPSRFFDPIKPGTFLPFGEGPRVCIAMRYTMLVMKYGLALLIMNYRIKLSPKTSVPLKFNRRTFGAFPSEKILLQIEKVSKP